MQSKNTNETAFCVHFKQIKLRLILNKQQKRINIYMQNI